MKVNKSIDLPLVTIGILSFNRLEDLKESLLNPEFIAYSKYKFKI